MAVKLGYCSTSVIFGSRDQAGSNTPPCLPCLLPCLPLTHPLRSQRNVLLVKQIETEPVAPSALPARASCHLVRKSPDGFIPQIKKKQKQTKKMK